MKRILIAAALAAVALPAVAAPTSHDFVRNRWGGVVRCELARMPSERAWCAGAEIRARDPARFDCARAEVQSEFDFCGLPYPKRER